MSRYAHSASLPAVALCVGMLTLAGCRIGPNYRRPAVPVPPAYRGTDRAGNGPGLGDLRWQQVFTDPVLQHLIEQARTHNPSVAEAAARIELIRAENGELRAFYGPEVAAQADETLQRISPIGLPKNRTTGDPAGSANIFGAQATWEIDFWGKYRRADEAARARLLASEAQQQAVLVTLVAQVARAYFDLRTLDTQSELLDQANRIAQRTVDLTEQKLAQGVVPQDAVDSVRKQAFEIAQQLTQVRRDKTEREDELSALTGQAPTSIPRGLSIRQQIIPAIGPGLPSTLLERRPDLRETEENLIAANAAIGVAEAAYLPNISLTAAGGQESTAFHQLLTQNADTWLLQPQLNLPVFTAGRIRAQVDQAKAQQQALVHAYQGAVLSALRDVSDGLAASLAARLNLEDQSEIVGLEQRTETLAMQRLDQGVGSRIASDRTQLATVMAQVSLAGSEDGRVLAAVRIFAALGGGWKD